MGSRGDDADLARGQMPTVHGRRRGQRGLRTTKGQTQFVQLTMQRIAGHDPRHQRIGSRQYVDSAGMGPTNECAHGRNRT